MERTLCERTRRNPKSQSASACTSSMDSRRLAGRRYDHHCRESLTGVQISSLRTDSTRLDLDHVGKTGTHPCQDGRQILGSEDCC